MKARVCLPLMENGLTPWCNGPILSATVLVDVLPSTKSAEFIGPMKTLVPSRLTIVLWGPFNPVLMLPVTAPVEASRTSQIPLPELAPSGM